MRSTFIRSLASPSWLLCGALAVALTVAATPSHATLTINAGDPVAQGVSPGTIGDFVWNDLNGNGIQDSGEPGVPNVLVYLTDGNGNFIVEYPTDANGHYAFTGLAPGNYRVGVKNPCPDSPTGEGTPATDSNSNPTDVTLGAFGDLTIDFGLLCGPVQQSCDCTLGYPDHSNDPRSSVAFNESECLVAFDPGPGNCGGTGATIKLWYSDEHALTLGVRQVVVKTSGGTTTTNFPVTPSGAGPSCVSSPSVGTTADTGDLAGNDVAAGGGRPLWPALFVTDITADPNDRSGDWQQGGAGTAPSTVCGVWKGAVKTIDKTHVPATVKVVPDKDPAQNHLNLGAGSDPLPKTKFKAQGYLAEVKWNVTDLGLLPGHSYRLQFMVHDGDQNKSGGDVGEGCSHATLLAGDMVSPEQANTVQARIDIPSADAGAVQLGRLTPNPFHETTQFAYHVDGTDQKIDIAVFDLAGRRIRSLVTGTQSKGAHQTTWDGRSDAGVKVDRGVYFLRAHVGTEAQTTRIMYLQ